MINIQRYPEGLLGLLNLANAGAPPQKLLETVQPVVDLTAHYASLVELPFQGTSVPLLTTGAFGVSYTVPGNDVRLVRWLTMRAVCGPTAPFSGLFACVFQRGGQRCYVPFDMGGAPVGAGIQISTLGSSLEYHFVPPVPWLLRPGDAFEVEASLVAAGGVALTISGLTAPLTT